MLKYPLASLLLVACQSGTVTIDLAVPTIDALNPLSAPEASRLSAFRLRRAADGSPVAESRFFPGDSLDLGRIPAGPQADYNLEGLSESGQILAFGQMRNLLVSADSSVEVTVELRKPIGYVGGGPQVLVRDTTKADTAVAAPGMLAGAASATAVTSTHDGSRVLLAVGMNVKAVATADHMDVGTPLVLSEPATRLV